MSARDMFAQTVEGCIFEAVRLQLEQDQDPSDVRKERLHEHLTNLAVLPETSKASWGKSEDDLVKWTGDAIAWIINIRKYCRTWVTSAAEGPQEYNIEPSGKCQLRFEELLKGVASLRDCLQKASERLEDLKAKNRDIEAQVQRLNHVYSLYSCDGRPLAVNSLEGGEIEQEVATIRAVQWEHFKGVKSYMSGLVDKQAREWQLHKLDFLERRITLNMPASPLPEDAPLELNGIIAASIQQIKQESDRVFVEIEEDLLHFKAMEYARLGKTLGCVEEAILGPDWPGSV